MEEVNTIREFNKYGYLTYKKDFNGKEFWYEYDENNNCIHVKNSDGFESWKEYDKNNNLIHYKNNDGEEFFYDTKRGCLQVQHKIDLVNIESFLYDFI